MVPMWGENPNVLRSVLGYLPQDFGGIEFERG